MTGRTPWHGVERCTGKHPGANAVFSRPNRGRHAVREPVADVAPRHAQPFATECSRVSPTVCRCPGLVKSESMSLFPRKCVVGWLTLGGGPIALLWVCLLLGCRPVSTPPAGGVLRLATTTSAKDSGLLDELLPRFETQQDCRVDVLAVGTGAALKRGELGEVDVLFVHAPEAEKALMEAGHGSRREPVMVNYFVVLGPESDPAGIRGMEPAAAFCEIRAQRAIFVSRGDQSGTHQRELALWEAVGGLEAWDGYQQTGEGMGHTLTVADQLQGYVLVDQGTYLKFQDKIQLVSLLPASESLINPYSVIAVNPSKHAEIHAGLATALIEFLISPETQLLINEYRVSGQPLFQAAHNH